MLKWDSKYELGHPRIDAEHRIFLGLVVDFNDAAERGDERARLARILNEISKYAEFHFVSEENLMTDCGYPERAEHARLHAQLLSELNDMCWRFRSEQVQPQQVFDFLFQWFALHTTGEDKKLVAYAQSA